MCALILSNRILVIGIHFDFHLFETMHDYRMNEFKWYANDHQEERAFSRVKFNLYYTSIQFRITSLVCSRMRIY